MCGSNKRAGSRPCQDCSEMTFDCGGDLYARKIDLALPSGQTHYRTCAGSCISALVVLATLFFIVLEVNHLMHENTFAVQSATSRNWFSDEAYFPAALDDESL